MNKNNLKRQTKIILVANSFWYFYNFRLTFLKDLKNEGYKVVLVAPFDNEYSNRIKKEGFLINIWKLNRKSINPFRELLSIYFLLKIYSREKPTFVHHFTIKACLYGTIAAKFTNIKRVINAVTGLGHIFLGKTYFSRILRFVLLPVYKKIFKAKRSITIFQNADDQKMLINLGLINKESTKLIKGSGVDTNYFKPIMKNKTCFHDTVKILFPSRIIYEKGFRELVEALDILWNKKVSLELIIAGEIDLNNPSSLNRKELVNITANPYIQCNGHVENMKELYSKVDIVVLPSWREGLSRTLIEAASMELPIITTDTPGCRDIVSHGITGLLVPINDPKALSLAIQLFIRNQELAIKFGKEARKKVLDEFQVSIINNETLLQYRLLLSEN